MKVMTQLPQENNYKSLLTQFDYVDNLHNILNQIHEEIEEKILEEIHEEIHEESHEDIHEEIDSTFFNNILKEFATELKEMGCSIKYIATSLRDQSEELKGTLRSNKQYTLH
eukprot:552482_1